MWYLQVRSGILVRSGIFYGPPPKKTVSTPISIQILNLPYRIKHKMDTIDRMNANMAKT